MTPTEFASCLAKLQALFNTKLTDDEKENYWTTLKHTQHLDLLKAITQLTELDKPPSRIPPPITLLNMASKCHTEPPQPTLHPDYTQPRTSLLHRKLHTLTNKPIKTARMLADINNITQILHDLTP